MNKLTEQQQAFLKALETSKTCRQAMDVAGYAKSTTFSHLCKSEAMQAEVKKVLGQKQLAMAIQALDAQQSLMDDPTQLGGATLRGVATDVLGQAGLGKQDSMELTVKQPDGMVELPMKVAWEKADGEKTDTEGESS